MKLNINKACDLNSISVFPPHARRANAMSSGPQSSQLRSQPRSQPSQQSFSQGLSSQHGLFSQLSQNSLDEIVTTDQRFGSQERENSLKKVSSLPPTNITREESQMLNSRSSTSLMRKWNPGSVPEQRCQISEELEHRLGTIETSLNRVVMILDSVQNDVMQVKKGTKEVFLETEGIQRKLIGQDTSLQLMNRGQEGIKASLEGGMKSISDQLSKDNYQDKLQQIFTVLSTLPEKMEASLFKLQNEFVNSFTKEIQAITSRLVKSPMVTAPPPKCANCRSTPQKKPEPLKNKAVPADVSPQPTLSPKIETGGWKSVKATQSTFTERALSSKENKRKGFSSTEQEREYRIIIDSDEEIDKGFSCLFGNKESGTRDSFSQEVKEETDRILRTARRRRRMYCNPIIIN